MKPGRFLSLLGMPVLACSLLGASISYATTIGFKVSLDTSVLVGHPAGPFYIDFQLIDGLGTGDANNTVTITNFVFGGGSAVGSPLAPFGGASGSLSSSVSITDSAFLNEFTQQFIPGTTLSFDVLLTLNVDSGPTPDAFSFAILDSLLAPIPTTGLGDALLLVNIDSASPPIQTFPGDPTRPPMIAISKPTTSVAMPETGSTLMLMLVAGMSAGALYFIRLLFHASVAGLPIVSKRRRQHARTLLSPDAKPDREAPAASYERL
jgi:hypothetical protein